MPLKVVGLILSVIALLLSLIGLYGSTKNRR